MLLFSTVLLSALTLWGGTAGSDFLPEALPAVVLLGLVVGVMVGLTSIGAGSIATPVLIMLFDVPPLVAVGSAIVAGAMTKGIGMWRYFGRRAVDARLVRNLLAGSFLGVGVVIFALYWMRHRDLALANVWVGRSLGFALVVLGVFVLAQDSQWVQRWQVGEHRPGVAARGLVIGVVVGLLFGATSIGTGSLLVVLLSIFLTLPEVRVVGSAILYGFVISLFAGLLHIIWGTVNWPLVACLLLGSIPGVLLGSELATHVPRRLLRGFFSVGAVWAGMRLF